MCFLKCINFNTCHLTWCDQQLYGSADLRSVEELFLRLCSTFCSQQKFSHFSILMFRTGLHLLLVGVSLSHNVAFPLGFPSLCRQLLVGVKFSLLPSPTCFSKTARLCSVRGAGVETAVFNQTSASGCSATCLLI